MKEIYLVIGKFSSWDSYSERVLKAFNSLEDAVKYADKANVILSKVAHHLALADRMNDERRERMFDMTDEEYDKEYDSISDEYLLAEKRQMIHYQLVEFNECIVNTVEIR